MKKLLTIISLLLITVAVFCQVTDSTFTVTYTKGQSFLVFIKDQMWTILAFALYAIWELVIGESSKIKSNSTLKMIYNFLKNMLAKKANKAALIVGFIMMAGMVNAQSPWEGFFGPKDRAIQVARSIQMRADDADITSSIVQLFRPSVSATGTFIEFGGGNPVTSTFSGIGLGVSYGKYTIASDGTSYCNYAIEGALWTRIKLDENTSTNLGFSVTGQFLNKFIGIGPAFYFDSGKIHPGIAFNFSYSF